MVLPTSNFGIVKTLKRFGDELASKVTKGEISDTVAESVMRGWARKLYQNKAEFTARKGDFE